MENKTRRSIVNEMVDTFGTRVIRHDGDVDEALDCLIAEVLEIDTVTREVAIELLAYAVRRMWYKRAETRVSLN